MSYILDALRRAEADRERERGQVPGLHTPPASGSTATPAAGPRRWLPWAGGSLLLLAGLGAGSWWAGGEVPPVPQPIPQPVTTPAAAPPPAVAAAPLPVPAAEAASAASAASAAVPAAPASPYLPAPPPAVVAAAPPPRAVPAPAPATPPAAEDRIPRLAELPDSLRRELPRLAISGSVYSEDPASRFVMINGEVMREGARLGADLVLERIGPRELVLRYRGQRFRQPV